MDDYRLLSDPINIISSEADSRSLIMPHQQEAVDALNQYFNTSDKSDNTQNGLMVMPTGSGKTFTAVNWLLTSGIANEYKIVWLAHRQELINQTNNEFRRQAPILAGCNISRLRILPVSGMAGHFKMSMASRADIYVCSIASVANKYGYRFIRRMLGEAGKSKLIVVVDEAHHIVAPQYQKVLKRITEINPGRLLLGLTATPTRMQDNDLKKLLHIFNIEQNLKDQKGTNKGYIYEVTLKQLLTNGFLAKPIREKVNTEILGEIEYKFTPEDESYFERYAELSEKVMSQIARSSVRNKIIVEQYMKNKERYGKTLIFAVNQMHAETLCGELQKQGIKCDYVVSGKAGAQQTINDFKQNKFDVLVNVQILTEGSDVPDIQTVFLTRETNSDSLLMQMIGRGLRGVKAGGTEKAYIVDFHDSWDKYNYWLDPGTLDIFNDLDNGTIIDEVPEKKIEVTNIEIEPLEIPIASQANNFNMHDFYMKLYNIMRASLSTSTEAPILPCGWYSVVNSEGEAEKILVYEEQLNSYCSINRFKDRLIKKQLSSNQVLQMFFDNCKVVPTESELKDFLELLYDTKEMPEYYSFEQREQIDPKKIADKMNSLFEKEGAKEVWLKDMFDHSSIIREVYKFFYAFKKTISDACKEEKTATIQSEDERNQYSIVDDYYDLSILLKEVLEEYHDLKDEGLMEVIWSPVVVKSWYGLCEKYECEDGTLYRIIINKLLSSPEVDREVIKYLIYHELLHANGLWEHNAAFREKEWIYPHSDELDGFLDEMAIRYNLEIQLSDAKYSYRGDEPVQFISDSKINSEPEQKDSSEDNPKQYKFCRNCGNRLPKRANFCDRCGEKMDY